MKINDFFTTKPRVLKSPTQFVLSNEHKEQQLEIQVKELKNELLRLKEVGNIGNWVKFKQNNPNERIMKGKILLKTDDL